MFWRHSRFGYSRFSSVLIFLRSFLSIEIGKLGIGKLSGSAVFFVCW